MRLLFIEDDPMIGESIQEALRGEHYAVDWVRDGHAASLAARQPVYDLVLLDLGLPRKDGLAFLAEYRAHGGDAPVMIITARDATAARVAGLDAGADDYLVKPFDLDELLARVRALLRRRVGRSAPQIEHGPLWVDLASHEVRLAGVPLQLSAREFAVLRVLLDSPGAVVPKAQLEQKIYGWEQEIESNALDVHIHHLRKKLGADLIRTVRGVGYKLAPPA